MKAGLDPGRGPRNEPVAERSDTTGYCLAPLRDDVGNEHWLRVFKISDVGKLFLTESLAWLRHVLNDKVA